MTENMRDTPSHADHILERFHTFMLGRRKSLA